MQKMSKVISAMSLLQQIGIIDLAHPTFRCTLAHTQGSFMPYLQNAYRKGYKPKFGQPVYVEHLVLFSRVEHR